MLASVGTISDFLDFLMVLAFYVVTIVFRIIKVLLLWPQASPSTTLENVAIFDIMTSL